MGLFHKLPKLLPILLAALVTTVGLMLMVQLPEAVVKPKSSVTVAEEKGIYRLALLEGQAAVLPPGAVYYPNTLLTPQTVDTAIPVDAGRLEALGARYLTQRFVVELPAGSDSYTLTVELSARHAMKMYVNGALAGQAGQTADNKQDTEMWDESMVCYATPQDGRLDIILQLSQFYHHRGGAQLATLTLEKTAENLPPSLSKPLAGLMVLGALFCAAGLLLSIFLLLSPTRATLFFTLACLAVCLREWIQSQAWIYFDIPGNTIFMLEYMSVVLLTITLALYLGQYAVNPFLKAVRWTALAGSLAYGMILLLTDSVFYTRALVFYQAFLVGVILPGIGGLFWTLRRPNREQAAALYGLAVFYISALSDIFMSRHMFGDGSYTTVSEMAMLVFMMAQVVSLLLMNNRVLSEAREAEQKLAAERDVLERFDRLKTEFLGNVAHELKTPLAVVSGYAQDSCSRLLAGEENSHILPRQMMLISAEAERMSLMIGQVLDVTRIDEGCMRIEPRKESIVEIVQLALDTYYPVFSKNRNVLILRKEGNVPLVLCDRSRITQILVNLISNAARHTREGQITIQIQQEGQGAAVTVTDTGEGIAAERLPFLFDRYYTQEGEMQKAGTGGKTGTGLGLYICKHIVEAHGGVITVQSTPQQGTAVRFTLPGFPAEA